MLSPVNFHSLLSTLTALTLPYNEHAKAIQTVQPTHAQQSVATPVAAYFEDTLAAETAEKIRTSLRHSLQANKLLAASQLCYKKFYSELVWPTLVQLAEKFLSCVDKKQQPIDTLLKKLSELPSEIEEMIWREPSCELAYWQAKTIPTVQNKPAYFLLDQRNRLVLDGRNQPVQDVRYRYHLLTHRDIPLKYQQQILVRDAQFHALFCNPQFRQLLLNRLLTQLTQKPVEADVVDKNVKQCVLLLFFLRTEEKAPLEECQQIMEIFQQYLAKAQPDTIGQALMELVQYLPCLLKFDELQAQAIELARHLSAVPNSEAKPAWVGPVWANAMLSENMLSIRESLLTRTWAAQYEPQIMEYLQQIIKRLQAGEAQSTELIVLARMRKYLPKGLQQGLPPSVTQDQLQQIINKNLPMLTEEIQSIIQTIRSAPHQKLGSLLKLLQLREFLTEAQQAEISTITKKNVRSLPKALWTQLLPFVHRLRPMSVLPII